uniref:Endoplasmic reticulum-based factor for assembly of V-ATPase n=1 Tax=Pyrodinium bahamense TaxID=73915 RepID=A0A7R9ZZ97_9DINO
MPTQVFVSITPEVRTLLSGCCAEGAAQRHAGTDSIELDELYRLADQYNQSSSSPVRIHELLAHAEVVERREACSAPLSELEHMRLESQERQYQQMVRGVAPLTKTKSREPGAHQHGLRFATNFATQVAVAFIGGFLLGYYFVETFVAPDSFTAKVIAGSLCSFATLLLETFLLVVHEQKKEMIEQRERNREERLKGRPSARQVRACLAATKASTEEQSLKEAMASSKPDVEMRPKLLREKKVD